MFRKIVMLCLMLFSVGLVWWGCSSDDGNSAEPGNRITGKVLLEGESDHNGIKVIVISGDVIDSVTTTENGEYEVRDVPTGTYVLGFVAGRTTHENKRVENVSVNSEGTTHVDDVELSMMTVLTEDVSTNTIWYQADGPYFIDDRIRIDRDVTLTIESGTKLLFSEYGELSVYGTLNAEGTSNSNIIFTTYEVNPEPESWGGIYIESSSENSEIGYAVIEYARTGIANVVGSCREVHDCVFQFCGNGISFENVITDTVIIQNNIFEYNENFGLIFENSPHIHGLIEDNTIQNNKTGIYTSQGDYIVIRHNTIQNHYRWGIFSWSYQIYIEDNIIQDNHIGLRVSYNAFIQNNLFQGGSIGVQSLLCGAENVRILENIFRDQEYCLFCTDGSYPQIWGNNFESGEFFVFSDVGCKEYTDSHGNLVLECYQENDVTAAENWWGTTNGAVIQEKIFDVNDITPGDDYWFCGTETCPIFGNVIYDPSLTQSNPNAGPRY